MEIESHEKSGGDSPRDAADSHRRPRPRWVRALVRTLKATGVLFLLFVAYTIWFIRGTPNPTVDYLAQLNALHRPSNRAEDNAWPYYEKAMGLVAEPNETLQEVSWFRHLEPPDEPLTSRDRKVLDNWIAANSPSWQQLEFATARAQCHRVYRRSPGKSEIVSSVEHAALVVLMRFTRMGLWKSRFALEQGGREESLGYCLTLLRAGAHWQRTAFLAEQLPGWSVGERACREILQILNTTDLSPLELSDLQARITAPYADGYLLAGYEGERLIALDAIQHMFTDGGLGGGHRIVGAHKKTRYGVLWTSDASESRGRKLWRTLLDLWGSMIHASRNRTTARVNHLYRRFGELAGLSPYERRISGIEDLGRESGLLGKWRYALVYTLPLPERRMSEMAFQARAEYEAMVTVVAVKRYRMEKGSNAPDLETLVRERYLDKLPMDPYSNGPLVYRLTGDGFTLYTVGPDFTDDGGTPGRDSMDRPKLWGDKGDTVFWPIGER